jgi:quinol monooxygenase YgiN
VTPEAQVIQINEYELVGTPDAFVEAITALADRTEREGHPGVLSYRFYVNRSERTAGAVIRYADADSWLAHHQMAYQWDEMPALQATVSLKRLILLGPLNDEILSMVDGAPFQVVRFDTLASGFVR